jgi:hypothetical protein
MREVFGIVNGLAMVAGVLYGYDDPNDHQAKTFITDEFNTLP